MKKGFIFMILSLFFLTGCDSYIELNDLVVINAIGIEKENNNYKVYLNLIENKDKDSKEISQTIIEDTGSEINQIIDNLSLTLNKKIYLSHLNLLVINDTIKNQELEEIINFFLNNNETREDYIVVSSNDIKKVLEIKEFNYINELIENNYLETSKTIKTSMFDIIEKFTLKEKFYIPYIETSKEIKLDGVKSYSNNKYEKINLNDVIYLNYYLNNIKTYKYSYKCSLKDNKFLYLNILKSYTKNLKDKLNITNEIKILNNDCNLKEKEINEIFNNDLYEGIKKFTNKKIEIKNIIRGEYEN